MNRFLQYINFFGVLILALVCFFQWRMNRDTNLEVSTSERLRFEQSAKLAEQDKALKGYAADLDGFREQLISANTRLTENEVRLKTAERETMQLVNEREQLRISVTNWANAVAARDERLKETADQLRSLSADRNDMVAKFNELAEKFNGVVDDLNTRTRDYNALVEKYSALVKSARTNSPQ